MTSRIKTPPLTRIWVNNPGKDSYTNEIFKLLEKYLMYIDPLIHEGGMEELIALENRLMDTVWSNEKKLNDRINNLEKMIMDIKNTK